MRVGSKYVSVPVSVDKFGEVHCQGCRHFNYSRLIDVPDLKKVVERTHVLSKRKVSPKRTGGK